MQSADMRGGLAEPSTPPRSPRDSVELSPPGSPGEDGFVEAYDGELLLREDSAESTLILEQRAEMRGRLVQAAMDGVLKFNAAALAGFRRDGGGSGGDGEAEEVIDVDMFDDVIELE